ncbi:GNAT family N-acetyltransferase [Chungangia koreensis]|uniref:GNAT family N-acetyltransferase n=1 Tax=Chungangia koreensis TaxID=752657 RepID=A0ABV8X5Q1_9LACT
MLVVDLRDRMDLFEEAVKVFWDEWGSETNYNTYYDAMFHACKTDGVIPRFYIVLEQDQIIGTYALLMNDFISRQDLYPWFACLYVHPDYRSKHIGSQLLKHAQEEVRKKGFDSLYLATDLDDYYEKYGWSYLADGYGVTGAAIKIYKKTV